MKAQNLPKPIQTDFLSFDVTEVACRAITQRLIDHVQAQLKTLDIADTFLTIAKLDEWQRQSSLLDYRKELQRIVRAALRRETIATVVKVYARELDRIIASELESV